MSDQISHPLLELLKERSMIDDLQYEEISSEAARGTKPVIQIILDYGILDSDSILQLIADQLATEVVTLRDSQFTQDLIKIIPAATAKMYRCVPVEDLGTALRVAFADPFNPVGIDELAFAIKRDVQLVVADPSTVEKLVDKFYGGEEQESVSDLLKDLGSDTEIARESNEAAVTDDARLIADMADAAPIVRFVNLVLFQAIQDRASDIHFEPFEDEFKIRYRVDGALYEMAPPPKHLALPVVSRIK